MTKDQQRASEVNKFIFKAFTPESVKMPPLQFFANIEKMAG